MGSVIGRETEPMALMNATSQLDEVEATLVSTRAHDRDSVRDQRRRASQCVETMPKRTRRGSAMALEALPSNRGRMSQIGAIDRDRLLAKVERMSKKKRPQAASSLDGRLGELRLTMHTMEGDGNCQFRSFAFNLFGSQSEHACVRRAAVEHMQRHSDYFGMSAPAARALGAAGGPAASA